MKYVGIRDGTIILHACEEEYYLPTSDLAVIAELTTTDGPDLEDYFIVLIDGKQRKFEICDNTVEAVKEIGNQLGLDLKLKLLSCVDLKTRIIYPPQFEDSVLFDVVDVPMTLFEKIKTLFSVHQYQLHYSQAAKEAFQLWELNKQVAPQRKEKPRDDAG